MYSVKTEIKIFFGIILTAGIFITAYFIWNKSILPNGQIEYVNSEYGFRVALPETWRNYSVAIDKWTGYEINDQLGDMAFTDGPVISIHNPKWTGENSYQDIPIMIFTLKQWGDLQVEKFHVGAAPINPSELGRNSRYVFALPARYNYSFPPGYEEVDQIMQSNPLTAF